MSNYRFMSIFSPDLSGPKIQGVLMFECLSQFGYFLAQGRVGGYRICGCYNKLFAKFLNLGKINNLGNTDVREASRWAFKKVETCKIWFFKANFDLNSHYVSYFFPFKAIQEAKITTISVSSKVSPCSVSASSHWMVKTVNDETTPRHSFLF